MNNQTLRNKIEQLFGLPAMKMPWTLYLAQLNEAGKVTAKSLLDIMTVVLTVIEEQEEKIKDLELLSQQPIQTISAKPVLDPEIKVEPKEELGLAVEEKGGNMYCANCGVGIINTTEWKEKHLIECKRKKNNRRKSIRSNRKSS